MLNVRKASIPFIGSCVTAALVFAGLATPANAADEQLSQALSTASSVTDIAGPRVVVDQTDGGQVRIDIPTTVAADPNPEAVLSHVADRDDDTYLDFSAATAAGVDSTNLNEFAAGFASVGGKVVGSDAHAEQSTAPSRTKRNVCVGRNRAWQEFLWIHIEIDSCKVDELVTAATTGAGAATAVAAILFRIPGIGAIGGTVSGIVAGLLAVGGGILKACGFPGGRPKGATLHHTGVVWCGTQS